VHLTLLHIDKLEQFKVKASYHFWAPWIGPKTRVDDLVFNSEYRKCHMIQEKDEDELLNHPNYSDEDLLNMMNFAQVGTCRFELKLQLISPGQTTKHCCGNMCDSRCFLKCFPVCPPLETLLRKQNLMRKQKCFLANSETFDVSLYVSYVS
jgi:hypothetical protein